MASKSGTIGYLGRMGIPIILRRIGRVYEEEGRWGVTVTPAISAKAEAAHAAISAGRIRPDPGSAP